MNSRERMLAAIHHEKPDRLPTDIWAEPAVWDKLAKHFGSADKALEEMHVDRISWNWVHYIGPALPSVAPGENMNYWRVKTRAVSHETGFYDEQIEYPLAFAQSVEDLDKYPWPQADWFDYERLKEALIGEHPKHVVMCGNMAPFYMHNTLRGMEQSMIDIYENPEMTHEITRRIAKFFLAYSERIFETCKGLVDLGHMGDDYGSQAAPLISRKVFNQFYSPHLKNYADLCHSHGIKVFHHDDGAIRGLLPDLINLGIDILNPVQWVCPGMELAELKKDFGSKLCFHGAVENQKVLPHGTPDDVRKEVRQCIDSLASDGTGFIVAPCHNIQDFTPVENIIALYEEAHAYGKL